MRKAFLFLTVVCLMLMSGCGKEESDVSLSDITLEPSSLSLYVNGQRQVQAKPVPAGATGATFAWTSADESVATVTQSGVVTGKQVGVTTVTVGSGSVQKSLPVSVIAEEVSLGLISVNRPEIVKPVGDTALVIATPVPANATDVSFSWSSANNSVATVDQTGIITITGVGLTTVTVSSGAVKAEIEVEGTVKSITLLDGDSRTGGYYSVGYRLQLRAVFDPADAAVTLEWMSSDEKVATVNDAGLVTILKSGTATITATVGEHKGAYTLSTTSPFEDVTGYWLFDDPSNLGKSVAGVSGGDLVINSSVVSAVAVPSSSNGAVRGGWEERGVGDNNVENIRWNHNIQPNINYVDRTKIRNYSVMMDIKVPYQDPAGVLRQVWAPLSSRTLDRRAALYLLWVDYGAGSDHGFGLAASLTGGFSYLLQDKTYQTLNPTTVKGKEKWMRLIYVFKYAQDDKRTKC